MPSSSETENLMGHPPQRRESIIYVLEFKPVSDVSDMYVAESRVVELQHLTVTEILKNLFKDTQWTVEESL